MYNGKVKTNFHDKKVLEHNECYACLSVLLLDFVVRIGDDYYP